MQMAPFLPTFNLLQSGFSLGILALSPFGSALPPLLLNMGCPLLLFGLCAFEGLQLTMPMFALTLVFLLISLLFSSYHQDSLDCGTLYHSLGFLLCFHWTTIFGSYGWEYLFGFLTYPSCKWFTTDAFLPTAWHAIASSGPPDALVIQLGENDLPRHIGVNLSLALLADLQVLHSWLLWVE